VTSPDVRHRRLSRVGPALIVLVGLAIVLGSLLALRHAGAVLVTSAPFSSPDAIVSLASREWERLPVAARLAHRFASSTLLLTVPPQITAYNCHDCAGRVGRLERMGVPAHRIRMLPLGLSNTYGEAVACLTYARAAKMQELLIVTSPYHTRRALAVFKHVFKNTGVRLAIEPATAESPAIPSLWWRRPYDRWYVSREWAATIYYAVRFGVPPIDR
jgi:uncharacterized SAM-binding protein YcdF (DUF218 family)